MPEDRDGFQDKDGCPDPDNDKDGIPDKDDQCPNDPEDKDGFEDEDGCPDPDNDKDGIPDVKDKCPNEPETYNGFEDEDGCPDKGKRHHRGQRHPHPGEDQVQDGSAEILPESNAILDAVATTLNHHPEFLLIEIAGHADERAPTTTTSSSRRTASNSVVAAARLARRRPKPRALEGLRRVLPRGSGTQRCGVGDEPPRRVQDRQDEGRSHRRRAGMPERPYARREPRSGPLTDGPHHVTDDAGTGNHSVPAFSVCRRLLLAGALGGTISLTVDG